MFRSLLPIVVRGRIYRRVVASSTLALLRKAKPPSNVCFLALLLAVRRRHATSHGATSARKMRLHVIPPALLSASVRGHLPFSSAQGLRGSLKLRATFFRPSLMDHGIPQDRPKFDPGLRPTPAGRICRSMFQCFNFAGKISQSRGARIPDSLSRPHSPLAHPRRVSLDDRTGKASLGYGIFNSQRYAYCQPTVAGF